MHSELTTNSALLVIGIVTILALPVHSQKLPSFLATPVCRDRGQYLIPHPRDCQAYFYCFEGQSYYGQCNAGYRFDAVRQSCLQSTVRECYNCPADGATNLPHPTSCQLFVMCFLGVAHERSCPDGLLFNASLGQCDLEQNVQCARRP
ncbi:probable chitinase 10 [Anopheles albimanus]|uniref:Chitin-binding type-2 domain-containing protein n=1 Tax=Anopheles albimanus TaxID=7167 RepID=A0A182FVW6_ANOAL|nr:probable chitinase 10 [Anopheles albimanus]